MTARAKDQSWCAICHDVIVGGERIVIRKGLWVHAKCWEREHE